MAEADELAGVIVHQVWAEPLISYMANEHEPSDGPDVFRAGTKAGVLSPLLPAKLLRAAGLAELSRQTRAELADAQHTRGASMHDSERSSVPSDYDEEHDHSVRACHVLDLAVQSLNSMQHPEICGRRRRQTSSGEHREPAYGKPLQLSQLQLHTEGTRLAATAAVRVISKSWLSCAAARVQWRAASL